jgi:predicted secreted protein
MSPRNANPTVGPRPGGRAVAALLVACAAVAAASQPAPSAAQPTTQRGEPDAPLLRLEAQAVREVPDDMAFAVLFAERDGPAPGPLQAEVNIALRDAIADLRRDPALQVRSGGYSTQPRYGREGRIEAWRVRGEVIVESMDVAAVSRATGSQAARLNVASIGFRLSPASRAQAEAALTAEAAGSFREKAAAAARALGFPGFDLLEVTLHTSTPNGPVPIPRGIAMAASAPPVPMEPGRTQVVVGFSGLVRLRR